MARVKALEMRGAGGRLVEGVYRIDAPGKVQRIIADEVEAAERHPRFHRTTNTSSLPTTTTNVSGGARKLWRFNLKLRRQRETRRPIDLRLEDEPRPRWHQDGYHESVVRRRRPERRQSAIRDRRALSRGHLTSCPATESGLTLSLFRKTRSQIAPSAGPI